MNYMLLCFQRLRYSLYSTYTTTLYFAITDVTIELFSNLLISPRCVIKLLFLIIIFINKRTEFEPSQLVAANGLAIANVANAQCCKAKSVGRAAAKAHLCRIRLADFPRHHVTVGSADYLNKTLGPTNKMQASDLSKIRINIMYIIVTLIHNNNNNIYNYKNMIIFREPKALRMGLWWLPAQHSLLCCISHWLHLLLQRLLYDATNCEGSHSVRLLMNTHISMT